MNFTFHLTEKCNLSCIYCSHLQSNKTMEFDIIKRAIDMSVETQRITGISFYGGEPLFCKDLIAETINYAKKIENSEKHSFIYNITTNGTMLDTDFLDLAKNVRMTIALSHDGVMQKTSRKIKSVEDTEAFFEQKIKMLLNSMPHSIVMTTIDPSLVSLFAESVEYLYAKGFRYFLTTPAFGKHIHWTDELLFILAQQYEKIADFYFERTMAGDKFYFGAFDSKIQSHIKCERNCVNVCHIGRNQFSVSIDGKLYPCVQFINDENFCVGDVFDRVDDNKQIALSKIHTTPPECEGCTLKTRCRHTCGCLNTIETGFVDRISPFQCEHERLVIATADKLAARLYKKKNKTFMNKHYTKVKLS